MTGVLKVSSGKKPQQQLQTKGHHFYRIIFSELMEGQREYYKKKKEREELGAGASHDDDGRMKEKVTKLIKMRRLAKMAQVLDTSTVCYYK